MLRGLPRPPHGGCYGFQTESGEHAVRAAFRPWWSPTQNPNMCTPYLRAISIKIKIFSSRIMRITENSSDSSSGRRPVSKSDEFLVIRIFLPEIMRCEHVAFPIHGHTYWDFESTGRGPRPRVCVDCVSHFSRCHPNPFTKVWAIPRYCRDTAKDWLDLEM